MRTEVKGDIVIAYPEGRIDSNNSSEFTDEFMKVVDANPGKKLEINMENIEYVSSAGLRIFLKLQKLDCGLRLTEVNPAVYEVLEMTDFTEILDISKALRRISVDGCEIIGQGYFGTVYRIDADTIVKVYSSPDYIPMIENEKRRAKQAFLAGIPTAIPYDLVRVGDSYGLVFELLKAKTLNDLIIEDPGCADEIITKYAGFLKLVHGTTMESESLPYAKDIYLGYVDVFRENKYLPSDMCDTLEGYLKALLVDDHIIHGDMQMKNVMMVDGEMMLIDMDTLMSGQPIFELGCIYSTYRLFSENDPEDTMRFLGITNEMADYIWTETFNRYYSEFSEAERKVIFDRVEIIARMRFLYLIVISDRKDGERGAELIKKTTDKLRVLISRVDSLN